MRVALYVLLVICFSFNETTAINLVDQPKLFSTISEWNQNLFKRVADCIRDTLPIKTDTDTQMQIKNWAAPFCNNILRILNENWANTNNISGNYLWGLRVIINQEFNWTSVAKRLYGSNGQLTSCGLVMSVVPDCAFVTP